MILEISCLFVTISSKHRNSKFEIGSSTLREEPHRSDSKRYAEWLTRLT